MFKIVDKGSARLRLPNELAVGVADSNHKEVCKFDSASSQKYLPVWYSIRGIVQGVLKGGSEPGKWSLVSLDMVVED
jgi:hypothetical protein